jgi:diphosphate-dependent phosphofructokinase
MEDNCSILEKLRKAEKPRTPKVLEDVAAMTFEEHKVPPASAEAEKVKDFFPKTYGRPLLRAKKGASAHPARPLKIGVVFSGGQAAGGHNVVAGLFDVIKKIDPKSALYGFKGGPSGIIDNKSFEVTEKILADYRNMGGFDLLGSGRTKIETQEQLSKSLLSCQKLELDGLVIIGGDDSNTNAAILAEYFLNNGCDTKVIGVPKTIDGDLKNEHIAISFGFDTACKVYSEMIGNIARDALSAKKYYHFIKLMGRSASHIALECALQTHANITLIGEEVAAESPTLSQIVTSIADVICKRAEAGKHYGIILIPEGLIEFVPEIGKLINELSDIISKGKTTNPVEIAKELSEESKACFNSIPHRIQNQLLLERDPHGNVQVSHIETERLVMQMVHTELQTREASGTYKNKFNPLLHFLGYEGRSGYPSHFDSNYCYALGMNAALLIRDGKSGYICAIENLTQSVDQWSVSALPITMLMNMEQRKGKLRPVIGKAYVDLKGKPYLHFKKMQKEWEIGDHYRYPGPIQLFGPAEVTEKCSLTLYLEQDQKI